MQPPRPPVPSGGRFMPPSSDQDITSQIFGWNPYGGKDPGKVQELPKWASNNHEIEQLTDLYQQQLAELVAAHNLLLNDQERLASALSPFVGPDGRLIEAPDELLLLIKKGLDLRLHEFEEDCRRLQKTERRLQRRIDECTLSYETSLVEAKGYADTRLVEQINEQQRLIGFQQHELDELRFQRDLYSDELLRLRQLCRYGEYRPGCRIPPLIDKETPVPTPRTLHREYSGSKPPFAWMRQIRHGRKLGAEPEKKRRDRIRGQPVGRSPPDIPFGVKAEVKRARSVSRTRPQMVQETETGTGIGGLIDMVGGMFGGSVSKPKESHSDEMEGMTKQSTAFIDKTSSSSTKGLERDKTSTSPPIHTSPTRRRTAIAKKTLPVTEEREVATEQKKMETERKVSIDYIKLEKEREQEEEEEFDETVDLRFIRSSSEEESRAQSKQTARTITPPPIEDLLQSRRGSGLGLTVGSRQPSIASSRHSSIRIRSPSRSIASPLPTTISNLTSEPLDRESASKFF